MYSVTLMFCCSRRARSACRSAGLGALTGAGADRYEGAALAGDGAEKGAAPGTRAEADAEAACGGLTWPPPEGPSRLTGARGPKGAAGTCGDPSPGRPWSTSPEPASAGFSAKRVKASRHPCRWPAL